jgi:hypothetical protein
MKYLLAIVALLVALEGAAQSFSLRGDVFNDQGAPLSSATVVLLNPADSTMEFFGITNDKGHFELKSLRSGKFLMHVAYLGYQTQYKPVALPLAEGDDFGMVVMSPKAVDVKEVQVMGEYIPLQIKNDTIEFNARAFKTRPDATVEELLKKMPGIEVDRAGNIKALGKDVRKVLVDGKEFFGNDPKLATKNLPADAIDKVQVYDKRSEESDFTGIDDGTRDKTVNLMLKEDQKKGIFGDVTAGAGTGKHYLGSGKAYRFNDKTQMALLGMMNNINQFGFSFGDYMSFSGAGLSASGGHMVIGGNDGFPINFGSPVSGLSSSGAGGANFSYTWAPESRIFFSYLANGTHTRLSEDTKTWNYTGDNMFYQEQQSNQVKRDTSHRINFGLRYRIDTTRHLIVNGNVNLSKGFSPSNSVTQSLQNDVLINTLNRTALGKSNSYGLSSSGSFVQKFNRNRSLFRLAGDFSWTLGSSGSQYVNTTEYFNEQPVISGRYQNVDTESLNYSGGLTLTQQIGKKMYLEPGVTGGQRDDRYTRKLGIPGASDQQIDSLSPDFTKNYRYLKPDLSLRRNTDKTQFNATLAMEIGQLGTTLWTDQQSATPFFYFTPRISWDNEYKSGRRLSVNYSSRVNTPSVSQLLPVVDNSNPLTLMYGNRDLKPEYSHDLFLHWLLFDQFSFTSLFTSLSAGYTQDKINWSRTVNNQLGQTMKLVNVDHDYRIRGNIDFSTPIKPLGIKVNASVRESYNSGINIVNDQENINTNLSHQVSLRFDNRKKAKWDVNTGTAITLTDSWYSIQESLNNRYIDLSWFGEVRFTPDDTWNFMVTADVTNYTARSFDESVMIPLIGAEVGFSFLKHKRGVLTLQAVDLLNRNTGISRVSEMNYLMERQTNMLGRYVMLSFKYRLNKMGGQGNAIDVKVNRR